MPSPVLKSLEYMLYGILVLAVNLVGSSHFSVEYTWSDEFATHSLAYRLYYLNFAWWFKRYFYYTAFLFQTGTAIACGLGYNGRAEVTDTDVLKKDPDAQGEHKWDKFMGVYWFSAETSTNSNDFLRFWNYRVHVWLKYYVSERIAGAGKGLTSM